MIKMNKKYIDKLGNVAMITQAKNFFGEDRVGLFQVTHIDHIYFPSERTIGRTDYVCNKDGHIENTPPNSPFNIQKRFTILDTIALKFNRMLFKLFMKNTKQFARYC